MVIFVQLDDEIKIEIYALFPTPRGNSSTPFYRRYIAKNRIFLYVFLSFKFFIGMQTANICYIENKCNHLRREKT